MKKNLVAFALSIAALSLSFFASGVHAVTYGVLDFGTIALSQKTIEEVSRIPAKPYFLEGFEKKTDPWESVLEQRRFHRLSRHFFSGPDRGVVDRSREGYVPPSKETTIREDVVLGGKTTHIIFAGYHFDNGRYSFWSLTEGEKNLAEYSPLYRKYEVRWALGKLSDSEWEDVKRVLDWAQFEAVRSFVKAMVEEGLQKNISDYTQTIRLTERVTERRAAILGDPDFAKRLSDPIPGTNGLFVKDLLPVPLTRAEDFLPDFIVVSTDEMIGGMTNRFKVPGSEVGVVLSLGGLAIQYISGFKLAAHEFVHANPYLQGTPLQAYYDVEMWAALTADMSENDLHSYLLHPYLAVLRRMARAHFGYNSDAAMKEIRPESPVGIADVREKEYRENFARVEVIRKVFQDFIMNPKDGFMVEFYSRPLFWAAVNTQFCDTAAAFRILFATRFGYAGIFDPKKTDGKGEVIPPEIQTMEWLSKKMDSGELVRLAKEAMEDVGKESQFAKTIGKGQDFSGQSKCPVDSRFFYAPKEKTDKLQKVVMEWVERAKEGDVVAALYLKRVFGSSAPFVSLRGVQ